MSVEEAIINQAAYELGGGRLPADQDRQPDAEFENHIGRGELKAIAATNRAPYGRSSGPSATAA